jgi:flagellar hook-associated protein 1 FlgK
MSISSLLNIGSRAMNGELRAAHGHRQQHRQRQHRGYSRQSVELETAFSQQTGNGFFGKGVNIATVTRAHSDFLVREAATGRLAGGGRRGAQQPAVAAGERVPLGEAGLGYAAQQMFNAFVDVANKPQDSSARQSVLAASASSPRASPPPRPARLAAERRHRPAEERGRLDQFG